MNEMQASHFNSNVSTSMMNEGNREIMFEEIKNAMLWNAHDAAKYVARDWVGTEIEIEGEKVVCDCDPRKFQYIFSMELLYEGKEVAKNMT
jgi:hypothetical protein